MRKSIRKFGAAALALAMAGSTLSMAAFADEAAEEETYDFGGQEIKVYGNRWNNLNPASDGDNTLELDCAKQVEDKYNVKLVYSAPAGYDGYNQLETIIASVNAGEGFANIVGLDMDALIGAIAGGFLAEITDGVDDLKIGSLYTDAATWEGKCYGVTFDNIGDTYVMVYSRDYLDEIGMDVTPTEKFMAGEWSYDEFKEYLTEMKTKLPEGVYPISMHYYHWALMAGAANGVVGVSSDGQLGINKDAYIEAIEFYKDLIASGLAAPMETEWNEEAGTYSVSVPMGADSMGVDCVITRVEAWEMGGLKDKVGEWGICYWPWGSEVTCEGDYTTLSDNYIAAQAYWGVNAVLSDAEEQTGIPAIVLQKISKDYYDLLDSTAAAARAAAYEAEQAGEEPVIGYEVGTARKFCTEEDYTLYDWGHTRVDYDWTWTFDDADMTNVWECSKYSIAVGDDARSTADSWYKAGIAAAADKGITLE